MASNPLPLAALAAAAAPTVIDAATGMLSKKGKKATGESQRIVSDSLDKPNKGERAVFKELYG